MQFLPLKSTFFVVINRLKTSEIISVILRLWQVVASVSAPVNAADSQGGSAQLPWWPLRAPHATAMLSANSQKFSWSQGGGGYVI